MFVNIYACDREAPHTIDFCLALNIILRVAFGFDKRKTLMSAATVSPFSNSNVPLLFRVQENPYGDHETWNQIY